MADKVASLYAELDLRDNMTDGLKNAEKAVKPLHERIKNLGSGITQLGADALKMSAPFVAGFGLAVKSAMDFDTTMTNTAAVMGITRAETEALGAQLLDIGMNSQAGPQAVAEAYYDIAGGVNDASLHMAILDTAIRTAEAGAADLAGTTKGLISVMNSYEFAVQDASYASDVMTRTVGMGVGSMDELASAMPQVAGLANSLGIEFADLGAMMAFLSTKGNTFAASATQISAMMTAMIKPNLQMTEALKELGFATGQAAIDALGLQGAYQALIDAGHGDNMAALTGSVEALRGVTALTVPQVQGMTDALIPMGPAAQDAYRGLSGVASAATDLANLPSVEDFFAGAARGIKESGAVGFMQEFTDGLDGATDAAQKIQNTSAQAQWKDITTDIQGLAIMVGQALLPALSGALGELKPFVTEIINFVKNNPQAVQGLAMLALGATAFGLVMMPLGWIVGGFGTAVKLATGAVWLLNGALGLIASPVIAGIAAGVILFTLFRDHIMVIVNAIGGFLGTVRDFFVSAWAIIEPIISLIPVVLLGALAQISNSPLFVAIRTAFETAFNFVRDSVIKPVVDTINSISTAIQSVADSPFFNALKTVFREVFGELGRIVEGAVGFINGLLSPIISLVNGLRDAMIGLLGMSSSALHVPQPSVVDFKGGTQSILNQQAPTPVPRGNADGGPVMAGEITKVGERGWEWFVPSTNGTIVNQRQASQGGMGGVTIGTLVLNGVNDPQKLFDEIQKVARQRSFA